MIDFAHIHHKGTADNMAHENDIAHKAAEKLAHKTIRNMAQKIAVVVGSRA